MRRPANAVRLACGHPMCDPGSAECRTRDILAATPEDVEQLRTNALAALDQTQPTFPIDRDLEPRPSDRIRTGVDPEWSAGAELHRSDCETNSYDSGPCDCGLGGLTAETLVLLLDDVRREQARAISEWRRTAPPGDIGDRVVENWRRARPGFARLLDLTDRP